MSASNPRPVVDVLREHVNRYYERDANVTGWRQLPEIPSGSEILQHPPWDGNVDERLVPDVNVRLPFNLVREPWNTIGDYVGTHYQLLREDAVAPLRRAVAEYKSQPSMMDNTEVSIYTHVYIIGMTFSNIGPAPRIEFSYERAGKRIRWKQSKRLQQGTIVALSPVRDKFSSICKVALVAARPLQGVEQDPPQIDLFWGATLEAEFDPMEQYIMIEAKSGYFEASRHMLVALQKLMTESFPLSEHLVGLDKSIGTPDFIVRQPQMNLSSLGALRKEGKDEFDGIDISLEDINPLENVNVLGEWDVLPGTKLDASQMVALRRIVAKKLAVVQGPPGTGKTFVSVSALKVMLDNLSPGDPPIIVAAQTNHALDQLLNQVASVEPKFLRLGGRTTPDNVVIKERTLYEVRSKSPRQAGGGVISSYRNARKALEATALQLQTVIERAINQGPEEVALLLELEIISQSQFDSLHDEDWVCAQDPELPVGVIASWLGREQLVSPPRCPSINMGFREEEDLEYEALEEAEAETGKRDDDDMDTLNGKWFPIKEQFSGRGSSVGTATALRIKKLLNSNPNLWDIPLNARGEVYRNMRRAMKIKILHAFRGHLKDYARYAQNLKTARWQADAELIKKNGIKLIGCTTTGLSKYRGLLASLQPRSLLIEEAAETLEGTILAAMFESLQQLILVGDHQQLQAHCTLAGLEKHPYNLSVSMFERLVINGFEYTMLNEQRRMIPEIRKLLDPFYANLQDHPSVLDRTVNRKPIAGMGGKESFFFDHIWPESRDDSLSRFNRDEADMIVGFFAYLVLNGLEPSNITVLTYYNGQRKYILNLLRNRAELVSYGTRFNVFTVDSYQGEENDVILLSLVRNNSYNNIGFLDNKNRAVVSLSRARRGFYIFGNASNLFHWATERPNFWKKVIDSLKTRQRLGSSSGLPIVCQNHKTEIFVAEPLDWEYLTGGCRQKCDSRLPCGHACPYNCHAFPHDEIHCEDRCSQELSCGHNCISDCGDKCRCSCDTPMAAQSTTGDIRDSLWQMSLDDVLADSSTEGDPKLQRSISRQSTPSIATTSVSSWSSPRKWKEWEAGKADEALQKKSLSEATWLPSSSYGPSFRDIHRPVTVENGKRIKQEVKNSASGYDKSTSSCVPVTKLKTISEGAPGVMPSGLAERRGVVNEEEDLLSFE